MGFLLGNLERGFLTTRGLCLPCLGGICSAKISLINREKKRGVVLNLSLENRQWHGELP